MESIYGHSYQMLKRQLSSVSGHSSRDIELVLWAITWVIHPSFLRSCSMYLPHPTKPIEFIVLFIDFISCHILNSCLSKIFMRLSKSDAFLSLSDSKGSLTGQLKPNFLSFHRQPNSSSKFQYSVTE